MNESTPINSELLSADARGKKHIPVAVFAVIMIHVILFVVLLVAAGCRASARAKSNLPLENEVVPQTAATLAPTHQPVASGPSFNQPVVATEPVVEPETPPGVATPRAVQPITKPIVKNAPRRGASVYVVQAGDTVGGIAQRHGTTVQAIKTANNLKNHLIRPGQKLRLQPEGSAETGPYQVKTSKPKRSNEV